MGTFGPIGLFDSGLGGLTVLRELRRRLPSIDFVYLGDTARVPYGTKSSETVCRYAEECAQFLVEREVERIVIACNTASSVALASVRRIAQRPVAGTIEATARAALQFSDSRRIGVIGTTATIRSRAFENTLRQFDSSSEVHAIACPLFVPLVEEGLFEGSIVESVIAHYLAPLRERRIDTLILGCTHYPLLEKSLAAFFGRDVKLISSAGSIAEELYEEWRRGSTENAAVLEGKGSLSIYVTDNSPGFERLASYILGDLAGVAVEIVKIGE